MNGLYLGPNFNAAMNKRKLFVIPVLPLIALFLLSWGVTGHRTIGKIAENHLTPKAKAAVQELLGNQSLADVATWADEVRSQPEYKKTGSWHFLNLPLGLSYAEFEKQVKAMTEDNVYSALEKCEHALLDKSTTRIEKTEALKFVVHFVGDLHQPMHISRAEDKGGNTIQLNYEGKGVNLHSLWDTYLLEHQGLSYEQLAEKYDHITPQQIKQWQSDPLMKWIWESYSISSQLYGEVDRMSSRSIDDTYYKAHIAIIGERIQMAGIRLAGVLNEIFKNGLVSDAAASSQPGPAAATATTGNKPTTVCEKVYSTRLMAASQITFLNLGGEYPNQKLSIVIKGKDRSKFPVAPELAFKDKTICVTGIISDYNGKPEIVVTDPDQIKIQ